MIIKVSEDFLDKETKELREKGHYYFYQDEDRAQEIISGGYATMVVVKEVLSINKDKKKSAKSKKS